VSKSGTTIERLHRLAGTTRAQLAAALLLSVAATLLTTASVGQNSAEAQYTADGTEHCLRCHNGERMRIMADTAHGDTSNPFTPYSKQGCEACHGPGSLHVSRARGGIGFPAMLAFRPGEGAQRQTAACLSCHTNDMGELEGKQWAGSVHATAGISCINCHQLHAVGNPLVERDAQVQKCATCHSVQITNHRRFENVGIVFDELKCYNCHDVHQMTREP
jgi:DmsE family decaheme c-type cytochrome